MQVSPAPEPRAPVRVSARRCCHPLRSTAAPLCCAGHAAAPRALATVSAGASFKLPELAYDYGALEPFLSGEIMRLHHTKHHNAYVTNLNAALDKYAKASASGDVAEMIALQGAIRFNGGGHVNHSIFWENLAPPSAGGGGEPAGALKAAIDARFGSFAALKAAMNAGGASVQGSGWVWLGYSKANARLEVATCANQDPLSTNGLVPLLGIDVWEHAYYLQVRRASVPGGAWVKAPHPPTPPLEAPAVGGCPCVLSLCRRARRVTRPPCATSLLCSTRMCVPTTSTQSGGLSTLMTSPSASQPASSPSDR